MAQIIDWLVVQDIAIAKAVPKDTPFFTISLRKDIDRLIFTLQGSNVGFAVLSYFFTVSIWQYLPFLSLSVPICPHLAVSALTCS